MPGTVLRDTPGNKMSEGVAALESVSQIGGDPSKFYLQYARNMQSVTALTQSFQKIIDEQKAAIESIEKQLIQKERLLLIGRIAPELAHEIRNPIFGVKSTLELLVEKFSEKDLHHRLIRLSLIELDRVIELICQMLDWQNTSREAFTTVDLSKLLREISDFLQPLFKQRNIQFTMQLDKNISPIRGVPNQLKQILINLFFNAMDAVEKDGKIRLLAFQNGLNIIMKVVDNGKGISPDIQNKLFEPYFTNKMSKNGVGLGLSVSQKIIQRHNGKITIESTPGLGTVVSVVFPIESEKLQKAL